MIRKLLGAVIVAAALLATAAPAQAAAGGPSVPPTYRHRAPAASLLPFPLCVTTTWRAHHTHHRKTRPGETCLLTADMWLPVSWRILGAWSPGPWSDPSAYVFLVVQRPRIR